jgi:hypothetical protein
MMLVYVAARQDALARSDLAVAAAALLLRRPSFLLAGMLMPLVWPRCFSTSLLPFSVVLVPTGPDPPDGDRSTQIFEDFRVLAQLGRREPDHGQLGPPVGARSTLVNDGRKYGTEGVLSLILGRDTPSGLVNEVV